MNKKLVLLMILSILLVFSSCGQSAPLEKEIEASEPSLVKVGVLPDIIDNETANNVYAYITEEHGVINADANKQIVKYEDFSSALSDLRAESIGFLELIQLLHLI